jgi:Short C-terminal domain
VSGEERLQQLERLAKLREAGVLSPEELEREKARILARA